MKVICILLSLLYVKHNVARSFAADEDYRRQRWGKGKRPKFDDSFKKFLYNLTTTTEEWSEMVTEPNLLNPRTEGIWEFEDLDYSLVIGPLKKEYQDCYGLNIRCLLDRSHVRPICVYNHNKFNFWPFYNWKREKYASQCELDYRNCMDRVYEENEPVYGITYYDDQREFYGEAYSCKNRNING